MSAVLLLASTCHAADTPALDALNKLLNETMSKDERAYCIASSQRRRYESHWLRLDAPGQLREGEVGVPFVDGDATKFRVHQVLGDWDCTILGGRVLVRGIDTKTFTDRGEGTIINLAGLPCVVSTPTILTQSDGVRTKVPTIIWMDKAEQYRRQCAELAQYLIFKGKDGKVLAEGKIHDVSMKDGYLTTLSYVPEGKDKKELPDTPFIKTRLTDLDKEGFAVAKSWWHRHVEVPAKAKKTKTKKK